MSVTRWLPTLLLLGLTGAAAAAESVATAEVDTTALRYYASRHESARVDAEIRRLRSLYPGWQPPADPAALPAPAVSDIQPLWDLFGADKLDELRGEIARRKAADPGWSPPDDLVAKLALKDLRVALLAASERGDDRLVLQQAAASPALVGPADLEIAWRVAEARARTGAVADAVALYRQLLGAVAEPDKRLATLRKAMAVLPDADLAGLLAMGRTGPDGHGEFDALALDLVRRHLGRVLAGEASDDASPADIARLEAAARSGPEGSGDAALLGWRAARSRDWAGALGWFQMALAAAAPPEKAVPADAKAALGAASALQGLGRLPEAEDLAWRWRDADPAITLLYSGLVEADLTLPKPAPLDAGRLQRFGAVVTAQQLGSGAQALGWYAYNVGQFPAARAWFEKAMAWQPRETTALGLALSLQRLGDKPALAAFLDRAQPAFPGLAAVRAAQAPAPAARTARARTGGDAAPLASAAKAHDYAGCLVAAARMEAAGRLSPAASLQKGWCLMGLGRPQEASLAFSAAAGADASGDAAYGKALAELRNNRADAAVAAASSAALSGQRRAEIGVAALAQQAAGAFDRGAYRDVLATLDRRRAFAPEPRDLMVLRAWSLYHLAQREEAKRLFAALDQQLSTRDTRAGLAAASQSFMKN